MFCRDWDRVQAFHKTRADILGISHEPSVALDLLVLGDGGVQHIRISKVHPLMSLAVIRHNTGMAISTRLKETFVLFTASVGFYSELASRSHLGIPDE